VNVIDYRDAATFVQNADLMFWSGYRHISDLIKFAGRSPASHVSLVGRVNGDVYVIDTREWVGPSSVSWGETFEKSKAVVEVVRISAQMAAAAADYNLPWDSMCESDSKTDYHGRLSDWWNEQKRQVAWNAFKYTAQKTKYGWSALWRTALAHTPVLWRLVEVEFDDEKELVRAPYCSAFVAYMYRKYAGVDLVRRLADEDSEPGDLYHSPLLDVDVCRVAGGKYKGVWK